MRVLKDDVPLPSATADARPWSSAGLSGAGDGREFWMTAGLYRTHRVSVTRDVLSPDNPLLRESIGRRPALVVMSPSVHRLYGRRIRDYFDASGHRVATDFMVLHRSESSKSLHGVVKVCERATAAGLLRTSPLVAIGGGVCSDVCGLAASLYQRGIPHINVPSTLVGLVDAGIGTKNAVNHDDRKNALGSFHPPEHSLLDPGFLLSLPRRHLTNGVAEVAKLAIVRDAVLFELLARDGTALIESGFRRPAPAAEEIIRRSVVGMLTELSQNLFETGDLQRSLDFGHTFSPYLEVASGYAILHGEAVAMDIALSTQIAQELGVLDGHDLDRILGLLQEMGLGLTWTGLSVEGLWGSLSSIIQHRNDQLHLVVPSGIGRCTFLGEEAISPRLLATCVERLVRRAASAPPRLDGSRL